MKRKVKKYVLFPVILLLYIVVMAVMSIDKYRRSGNWSEFFTILGISLLVVLLIFLIQKRQQKIRDRFSQKD